MAEKGVEEQVLAMERLRNTAWDSPFSNFAVIQKDCYNPQFYES